MNKCLIFNLYKGITIHFVDDQFKLQSYLLSLRELKSQHTSENLLAEIENIFNEWSITEKIVAISADGAHNIAKVFIHFS